MSSIQDLLLPGGLRSNLFPPTSRYAGSDTNTLETADGKTVIYIKRRFLPQADEFVLMREHTVRSGERLDNVTAQYLSDPEQYWQICDANNISNPIEAEEVGRRLRITFPRGIGGGTVA